MQVENLPDVTHPPFSFPERYRNSLEMMRKNVRSFATTSVGRLFDTAAALLGFTRPISFEGQAAMCLEQLSQRAITSDCYPFAFNGEELDFRPLLHALAQDTYRGRSAAEIARAFQRDIAGGLYEAL